MTREEALKIVRLNIGRQCGSMQEAIKTLVPELTESEDETHRKWILEYLYDGLRNSDEQFKGQFKSAIDWLKKQKEQKPAEWSEEDEEMLDLAIEALRVNGCETLGDYLEERFKSLRPSWKPSEKQMKALHNFAYTNFFGDGDCEVLRSLYEDLKKQI